MKGGTAGNSAFGKRKIVTSDADPNPQACMLNYPPQPTEMNLKIWKDNCAPRRRTRRAAATAHESRRSSSSHRRAPPSAPALPTTASDAKKRLDANGRLRQQFGRRRLLAAYCGADGVCRE